MPTCQISKNKKLASFELVFISRYPTNHTPKMERAPPSATRKTICLGFKVANTRKPTATNNPAMVPLKKYISAGWKINGELFPEANRVKRLAMAELIVADIIQKSARGIGSSFFSIILKKIYIATPKDSPGSRVTLSMSPIESLAATGIGNNTAESKPEMKPKSASIDPHFIL
ncbi:MAG: hypothetical protein Q8P49_01240 [Candidatus Liptonbacteria bacterium]|nr:hypothetical protein [Candidatus Liptonbacteria bacterium]